MGKPSALTYVRKAVIVLKDTVDWNLSAGDGKLARLSKRDIQHSLREIQIAKGLITKAEVDLQEKEAKAE